MTALHLSESRVGSATGAPPVPADVPAVAPGIAPAFDPNAPDAVSVVIPTYNRAHLIGRAARSVLSQTHRNLELVVADDASTDGTEAVVRDMAASDPRVVYLRAEANGGAAAARNLGLSAARAPLVAFQDSDDEWLVGKLAAQVALMGAHPELIGTFGAKVTYGTDDEGRFGPGRARIVPGAAAMAERGGPIPERIGQDDLVRGNLISPQTFLVRRDAVARAGGFDTRLHNNEDWELMLRLGALGPIAFTGDPVVVAHVQDDSISRSSRRGAHSFLYVLRKHRALFARHPQVQAAWYFRAARHLERIGKRRGARLCSARAVHIAPGRPRHWAGLARAWLAR